MSITSLELGDQHRDPHHSDERRAQERRHDDRRQQRPQKQKVNWTAVGVWISLAVAMLSWFASGASDYRNLGERVTAMEVNRANDSQRIERIENKIEKVDDKVDRVLERLPNK